MDTKDAGRLGGLARGGRKAEAARINGKQGGRPRKRCPKPVLTTLNRKPEACGVAHARPHRVRLQRSMN
jgi:hypothetical protein